MKKLKKFILTLLVMSLLIAPVYLTLQVNAANEELAMSRISDTLQRVMKSSPEEKIEVMIWLKDGSTSSTKLTSTEAILAQAKETLSRTSLCENPATDAELYSQYLEQRKIVLMNHYSTLTYNFASTNMDNIDSYEDCYISRYAPVIICNVASNDIYNIAHQNEVAMIDISNYEIVKNETSNNETRAVWDPDKHHYYFTMAEVKNYLGINTLRNYASANASQINIGVIDAGYPLYYNSLVNNNVIEHYSSAYKQTSFGHSAKVLDILFSIIPEATFYYSNFEEAINIGGLYNEIEWLMDNNVHIITCSLEIHSLSTEYTDDSNEYGAVAKYLDFIINTYLVTFVTSAGNDSENGVGPCGTAYNVIAVGNYCMADASISGSSSYNNGEDFALKPDVCAPGFINFSNGMTDDGTSFSTPIVSGIAALIIASYDEMINPIMLKTIICTGTGSRRYPIIDTYGDINLNYRKYGAGVVDCWYISDIINSDEVYYDAIYPNEVTNQFIIYIEPHPEYSYADIALVFEKNNTYDEIEYSIANLDLNLYDADGELVASSTTEFNNVEILRNVPTYDDYYILVIKQINPATSEYGSTATSFSFAWVYKE